jgi:hypothetical protein
MHLRQQDAAREGLEAVVDQPQQRLARLTMRDGWLPVAHDHLDLLAAFQHAVVAQAVGARALAGESPPPPGAANRGTRRRIASDDAAGLRGAPAAPVAVRL